MTNKLLEYYEREFSRTFSGWDYSYIFSNGRAVESPLPWNYYNEIIEPVRGAKRMLDMGTGGGEFVATLAPLPKIIYATEAYKPNVPIAKKRLSKLGVLVISDFSDDAIPIKSGSLDLIINRHESFSAKEVYRMLKSGGTFITQQVGGMNDADLNKMLGAEFPQDYVHWDLKYAVKELRNAGFKITSCKEEKGFTRFYDIGALLFYIKAEPWQIPDFSVKKYFAKIKRIDELVHENGYVDIGSERFLVKVEKSA